MKLSGKGNRTFLTVNRKRCGVRISAGPWVPQCDPAMIQIRCKKWAFPAEFGDVLDITNRSDGREDYFERDVLRIFPGHELYEQAKAIAAAS